MENSEKNEFYELRSLIYGLYDNQQIINEKLDALIKVSIDNIQKEVDINERDRIRYEILQFSGSLRNGLQRTQNDFDHIEELYEKYHKKGWNSYIHSEMDFIRECRNKK